MISSINAYMPYMYTTPVSPGISAASKLYDYKSAMSDSRSFIDSFQKSQPKRQTLGQDSYNFLESYTKGMAEMGAAANKLSGSGLQNLLYDDNGEKTEETIQNTVNATQNLVDAHNDNLQLLAENRDRGVGALEQQQRMEEEPADREALASIGIETGADGRLSLNQSALAQALEEMDSVDRAEEILGGESGLARGIRNEADAGQQESAGRLIEKDLQAERTRETTNVFSTYNRQGATEANNTLAAGLLMNMAV